MTNNIAESIKCAVPEHGNFIFDKVNDTDKRVWATICRGDTTGIFQIESRLGTEWSKKLKPQSIQELATVISLIRPGNLESGISESYYKRKIGEEEVDYPHESVKEILDPTYGKMVFQEQIISIGIRLAGMSEEDADLHLRKSLSKKLPEAIAKAREAFLAGCNKRGVISDERAKELFDQIEKFQRYGFNKCLSLDTIVETKNGERLLSEIKIGDLVRTVDDNSIEDYEWTEVIDTIDCGEQEVFNVELDDGKTIKCTMEHEFWCKDGKKYTMLDIIKNNYSIICENGSGNVKSVNYIGKIKTLDLTVNNEKHRYFANGILTSNSHAVGYAKTSYFCAYIKTHFPTEFYCSWLTFANDKPEPREEIARLVNDAKLHNITVLQPDIQRLNKDFTIIADKKLAFGLSHIRGVGGAALSAILETRPSSIQDLVYHGKKIKRSVVEAIIKSGACDSLSNSRNYMLRLVAAIYGKGVSKTDKSIPALYKPLTANELRAFLAAYKKLNCPLAALEAAKDAAVTKRIPVLDQKIQFLRETPSDTNRERALWEKLYLGIPITCSAADDFKRDIGVLSCRDAVKGHPGLKCKLQVVVDAVNKRITGEKSKTPGREYAILEVSDNSAKIDIMIWPAVYDNIKNNLFEGSVVCINIRKDEWNNRENYICQALELIG